MTCPATLHAAPSPPRTDAAGDALLTIENLHTYFFLEGAPSKAVEGVDLQIPRGRTLGLVGESGCGKSATALSIMRLIPSPPGRVVSGRILMNGRDLLALTEAEMRRIRGKDIGMIFQEPMTSLNPVFTVGNQIVEAIRTHEPHTRAKEARARAVDLLRRVHIPSPAQRVDDFPHQMSGGMRQRVMIAMALACGPHMLIADEPTTALDVTIQAQIMDLFTEITAGNDMSVLLITHNLGVVAQAADEVAVMYAGHVVEKASTLLLFAQPRHPYTRGLMKSVPRLIDDADRLHVIPGNVPDPASKPPGCPFHPRCEWAFDPCSQNMPPVTEPEKGHQVRCWAVSENRITA